MGGKEPYVICKLKCHDGYELEGAKLAKCEMESGSWTQQASGECHPIPWTPEESECELPKKINKKLQNGAWSCKTKLSNDYRGESDYDTAGQVIITDSTEWADLLDDNESGEWRKEKNKDKEMVMCCTLNCDAGYKPNGSNTANCAMKSNTWYGNFNSICVADWQPKCAVPAPIYGGAWSCNTMLVDPTQRKPDLPKMIKIEDGMSTQDLINPTQAKLSDGDNSHNLNGCLYASCGAQRTTKLLEIMSSSATWTLVSGLAQCQLARPSVLLLILRLTLVASPPHQ